jgi:hypothetical protein
VSSAAEVLQRHSLAVSCFEELQRLQVVVLTVTQARSSHMWSLRYSSGLNRLTTIEGVRACVHSPDDKSLGTALLTARGGDAISSIGGRACGTLGIASSSLGCSPSFSVSDFLNSTRLIVGSMMLMERSCHLFGSHRSGGRSILVVGGFDDVHDTKLCRETQT